MRVRKIDENGDWTFGKGKSNYAVDIHAVLQSVATRLRSFLGDCFFDITHGVDWWGLLGGKDVKGTAIAIRSQILNTEGVTRLAELDSRLDENRNLSVAYSVHTVYSVSEPVIGGVEILDA